MKQPLDVKRLVRQLRLDPLPQQLRRAVHVVREMGMLGEIDPLALPQILRAAVRQGVKSRSIHTLHALNHPGRLALVDDHRSLTYGEVENEINRLAQALRSERNVRAGTPVVLMMENCTEYVVAWFALARLGARAVHASYRLTAPELDFLVQHSGAHLVISSESALPVAAAVRKDHPELNLELLVASETLPDGGTTRLAELVSRGTPEFPSRQAAEVPSENIVYTSGTTGKPKGAVRDFASFGPTELFRVLERLPFHTAERHLIVSPLYHSAGQIFTMLQSAIGATIYLRPHFDPEDTLRALSHHRIETVFMVPTMIRRLVTLPDVLFDQNPTPSIRGVISGAAEFPHALREQAIKRFGARAVHDFYGATELGWVTLINGEEMLRKPGSVGRALAAQEVQILDEQGNPVPRGSVGTVYVRNAQTMSGYLNDATATRDSQRGEWMTVDDLGYQDQDGYLFLAGRTRDMLKSGGVNIYPVEIEEVLSKHPSVLEVAVVGLPDPEWGERVTAIVVPRGSSFDAAEVEKFARLHLSGTKIPRRWELVTELPRNATGKVLKKELRQRFSTSPAA